MSSDIDHAKSIFLSAAELPAGPGREAFLAQACGADVRLRGEVDELLAHHRQIGSFLDQPENAPTGTVRTADVQPGAWVGRYRLLELIGAGGMGAVWMAQQTEPIRRTVALKLIRAGMDTAQVLARFEAERQALALMDHPNIAKVFDGGTLPIADSRLPIEQNANSSGRDQSAIGDPKSTILGRPYFVMELVKGIPITKFCDEHHLTPRQRLELFVPVCHAIQHAHQKGIIHRDIKPSNVLVALYDDRPVPKVIDFGVAKATGQQLTEETLHTGFGAVVGTVEYMSPEQASFNQLDVDTRSDIYSLGVLLYELLAGTPPFTKKELEKAGMLEMLRVIREQEPSKPSTKLSTADGLPTLAAKRGTEPAKLTKQVRGELDWIVMKALEKDRSRRYETANGFALDVQRYLADEAVHACPPSAAYRLRKFVHRNKAAVVTTALGLACTLLLLGGVGWVLMDRSSRHAKTVAQVEEALADSHALYRQGKLPDALAGAKQAHALVQQGGGATLLKRADGWLVDLEMANRLEEASQLRVSITEESKTDDEATIRAYAAAFRDYGIDIEAEATPALVRRIRDSAIRDHLTQALDNWVSLRPVTAEQKQHLFAILNAADDDDWRRRLRSAAQADAAALKQLARDPSVASQPATSLLILGGYLQSLKEFDESARVLSIAQKKYPSDFWVNYRYGLALGRTQKPEASHEARRYLTAAIALRPESPAAHLMLGMLLRSKNLAEAAPEIHEAIRLQPNFGEAHFTLANILMIDQRDYVGAIAANTKAIEANPKEKKYYGQRSSCYLFLKQFDLALRDCEAVIRLDPSYFGGYSSRAGVYRTMGRNAEAIADYTTAIQHKPDHGTLYMYRGEVYRQNNQLERAVADFTKAIEVNPDMQTARQERFKLYKEMGQSQLALADLTVLNHVKENDPASLMRRGSFCSEMRLYDEAIRDYTRVIELRPDWKPARIARAHTYLSRGDPQRAIDDLTHEIKRNDNDAMTRNYRGRAYFDLRDWPRAVEDYTRAVELSPGLEDAWIMLGHTYKKLKNDAQALASYSKAIEITPGSPQPWLERGRIHADARRWPEAVRDFSKVVEREPNEPSRRHCLVAAQLAVGDNKGYRAACAAALQQFKETKSPDVAARIVNACVAAPIDDASTRIVLELSERAMAENSDWNAGFRGAALFRAGKFDAALTNLERRSRAGGARAWDMLFMAMIHHHRSEPEKAAALMKRAAAWIATAGPYGVSDDVHPGHKWFNWEDEVDVRALFAEASNLLKNPKP